MADYLPAKDSELVAWSANFIEKVTANAAAWAIPAEEVTALRNADSAFAALHAQADSPEKNTVIVAKKNAARTALVEKIRALAGFHLKNPVITDAERTSLGLHVRSATYTPVPAPKSRPEFDVDVLDIRMLKIHFHDRDSGNKARPYGTNGAVVIYAVLDAPPATVDALSHSELATRTPHIIEFSEKERGKTVYLAMCWQNDKGERGPWSNVQSAIIP
jgi:hypothetical protein